MGMGDEWEQVLHWHHCKQCDTLEPCVNLGIIGAGKEYINHECSVGVTNNDTIL